MNDVDKLKNEMAMELFGRNRSLAIVGGQCVRCGEFNIEFRDELSRKEYYIFGLCQCCQDSIFSENEPLTDA